MTVPGSQMPPEIWEVTQEAGAANCHYYSDRWRRSTKPPVGNAASEMPNTVPGSSITATQSVDSAKSISANRGFSFEGDDYYLMDPVLADPSDVTICAALSFPSDSRNAAWGSNDTGGSGQARLIEVRGGGNVDCRAVTDTQDQTAAASLGSPSAGDPIAIACSQSMADGTLRSTARSPSSSDATEETVSGVLAQQDVEGVGANGNGTLTYNGIFKELLIVRGISLDLAMLSHLRDAIYQRHQ